MKKLIAFFDSDELAKSVAEVLSEKVCENSEISLNAQKADQTFVSGYAYKTTLLCAAAGIILGLAASQIRGIGFFGTISPVTGLIIGCVVGAITGCLLDFLTFDGVEYFSRLSLFAPDENEGYISRILKKRGALSVCIEK